MHSLVGIRSTRILTRDDVEITIPNSIMGNTRIVNESGGPHEKFCIKVAIGVAYGSDIDRVRQILHEIAIAEAEVCTYPEPRIRFVLFGASSLDFELQCWVENPELRGRALYSLNSVIYKRFMVEDIESPTLNMICISRRCRNSSVYKIDLFRFQLSPKGVIVFLCDRYGNEKHDTLNTCSNNVT